MNIAVVSRQPPCSRSRLYMEFADAVADATDGRSELLYARPQFPFPDRPMPVPPALLIDGEQVIPTEGKALSPGDVCAAAVAAGFKGDAQALLQRLEQIRET